MVDKTQLNSVCHGNHVYSEGEQINRKNTGNNGHATNGRKEKRLGKTKLIMGLKGARKYEPSQNWNIRPKGALLFKKQRDLQQASDRRAKTAGFLGPMGTSGLSMKREGRGTHR